MINLPLYFMRFPQEIKGEYYKRKSSSQMGLMTMDTPEWPVAYCFNEAKDKIEVYVWWVPVGKKDPSFHDLLNGVDKQLEKPR